MGLVAVPFELLIGLTFTMMIPIALLIIGVILSKGPALTIILSKLLKGKILWMVNPNGILKVIPITVKAGCYISKTFGIINHMSHSTLFSEGTGNTAIAYSNINPSINVKDAFFMKHLIDAGISWKQFLADVKEDPKKALETTYKDQIEKAEKELTTVKIEAINFHDIVTHLEFNEKQTPKQIDDLLSTTERRAKLEALGEKPEGSKFPILPIIIIMVVVVVGLFFILPMLGV